MIGDLQGLFNAQRKENMVEKIEINQVRMTDEIPAVAETAQKSSSVESLVMQLGVPVDRIEQFTGALNTAFDNDPKRVIGYLTFKIARRKEQL